MKKYLFALLVAFGLAGCSGYDTFNNNRETRYFAYVGEPVAVLYDNFGTPIKGIQYTPTERALVFHTQDFDREWAYTDYRYCDVTFYLTNDIVTGWEMVGNQCAINEEATGIFNGWFSGGSTASDIAPDTFDIEPAPADMWVDADAFDTMPIDPVAVPASQHPYGGHVIADDAF